LTSSPLRDRRRHLSGPVPTGGVQGAVTRWNPCRPAKTRAGSTGSRRTSKGMVGGFGHRVCYGSGRGARAAEVGVRRIINHINPAPGPIDAWDHFLRQGGCHARRGR
jgi:hypothetical protein